MDSVQLESQSQDAAIVSLNNKTSMDLKHQYDHSWSGSFSSGSCPSIIKPNTDASFIHLKADGDKGSSALVQYSGFDAAGQGYSVIIAWDAPSEYDPSTSPNKVYVMSGPRSVVDPIGWNEIEMLLKNASSSASSYGVEATISCNFSRSALVDATVKFA